MGALTSAKPWRSIVPLVSTRTEVEQLLGARPAGIGATYNFPNETVHIYYAMLTCKEWPQPPRGWDVPKNTVVRVLVYPKAHPLLESLGIDLSAFRKEQRSSCIPQEAFYVDDAEGFAVQIMDFQGAQTVFGYEYYPSAEQSDKFQCRE